LNRRSHSLTKRRLLANPHPSPPPHHKPRNPRPQSLHLPGRQAPSGRVRRAVFLQRPVRHAAGGPAAHCVEAAERI